MGRQKLEQTQRTTLAMQYPAFFFEDGSDNGALGRIIQAMR